VIRTIKAMDLEFACCHSLYTYCESLSTVQVPISGDDKETTAPAGGCILFPRRLEGRFVIPVEKNS
jgi:hypothetical protein